jgi:hypothetical protein
MFVGELISGVLGRLIHAPDGYRATMPYFKDEAALCIDAYELGVRAATDLHLAVAKVFELEPLRSLAATCADLTRDIGAAQVSSARWFLDV